MLTPPPHGRASPARGRVGLLLVVLLSLLGMHGLAPHAGVVHDLMAAHIASGSPGHAGMDQHAAMGAQAAAPVLAIHDASPGRSTTGHHDLLHLCLAILLVITLATITAWLAGRRLRLGDPPRALRDIGRTLTRGRAKDPPALSGLCLLRC